MASITQDWAGIDRRRKDRREALDRREFIRYLSGPSRSDRRAMVNRRRTKGDWSPTHLM